MALCPARQTLAHFAANDRSPPLVPNVVGKLDGCIAHKLSFFSWGLLVREDGVDWRLLRSFITYPYDQALLTILSPNAASQVQLVLHPTRQPPPGHQ